MTSEPFLKPRLTGPRFEGGAIPLEVLADFAVLSEMIIEVVKWKYRKDNPTRKRFHVALPMMSHLNSLASRLAARFR